jgi:hypothetical protein
MMRAPSGFTTVISNMPSPAPAPARAGEPDRLMHAMTAVLAQQRPASAAEALRLLRRGYPDIPLEMRIAALRAGSK